MLIPSRLVRLGQDLLGFTLRPRRPSGGRAGDVRVPAQVVIAEDGEPLGGLNPARVAIADGAGNDAFSRLRVALPKLRLSAPFDVDDRPLYWATRIDGTGDASYIATDGLVRLATTGAGVAARQTRERFVYRAGQSQLVFCTFTRGSVPAQGATWAVGYFDEADGIFLRVTHRGPELVIRSSVGGSVTEQVVGQADWNLDRLDGSGRSGFALDVTKSQILVIDFQALFVGRVRVGFDIDGLIVYAHAFHHANRQAPPYIRHARLPVRYEVSSSGPAVQLDQVCATVVREGGDDDPGVQRAVRGGMTAGTTLQTVAGVRLKADQLGATIRAIGAEVLNSGSSVVEVLMVLNPELGGEPAWKADTGAGTIHEFSRSTLAVAVDGDGDVVSDRAVVLAAWHVSGGGGGPGGGTALRSSGAQSLGERLPVAAGFDADERDELWLCVRTNTSTSAVLAHLTIEEIR